MPAINIFVVRDDSSKPNSDQTFTPLMSNLLIAFLCLILLGLALVVALFTFKYVRKNRQQSELPLHNSSSTSKRSNHRRLTITATPFGRKAESVFVINEKQAFIESSSSPPISPVPEIRITFPEEEDDKSGKRKSGRVVVVRITENGGVGLEPYQEECLPPYQSSESDRFQSLDLERMGGLKEKEHGQKWS